MYEVFVELAQKKGVTAYKVAKAIGVSQQVFTDWKTGRSTPKADKLLKIANYFGVSVDYLMTGEKKEAKVTEEDLKIALFGGDSEVTDEMWQEAINFANFIKERELKKGNNDK